MYISYRFDRCLIIIGLVYFYGISTCVGYLMPNPLHTYYILIIYDLVWWHINYYRLFIAKSSLYIYIIYMIWLGLSHINHWRIFNAKSSFYIYIYIWFGLIGFYGTSTIVGYLIPNPLHTYILIIYDLVWWHINYYRLFIAKSSLYIYIWFGLIGFYGTSTIVGFLMPNPLYTYILNIYDLVWLDFMAHQPL